MLVAEGIVVGFGGFAVVNAEACVGLQTGAGEDKRIFYVGAEGVLRSNQILIFAIEKSVHGRWKM